MTRHISFGSLKKALPLAAVTVMLGGTTAHVSALVVDAPILDDTFTRHASSTFYQDWNDRNDLRVRTRADNPNAFESAYLMFDVSEPTLPIESASLTLTAFSNAHQMFLDPTPYDLYMLDPEHPRADTWHTEDRITGGRGSEGDTDQPFDWPPDFITDPPLPGAPANPWPSESTDEAVLEWDWVTLVSSLGLPPGNSIGQHTWEINEDGIDLLNSLVGESGKATFILVQAVGTTGGGQGRFRSSENDESVIPRLEMNLVPEPGSATLALSAAGLMLMMRRRRGAA